MTISLPPMQLRCAGGGKPRRERRKDDKGIGIGSARTRLRGPRGGKHFTYQPLNITGSSRHAIPPTKMFIGMRTLSSGCRPAKRVSIQISRPRLQIRGSTGLDFPCPGTGRLETPSSIANSLARRCRLLRPSDLATSNPGPRFNACARSRLYSQTFDHSSPFRTQR